MALGDRRGKACGTGGQQDGGAVLGLAWLAPVLRAGADAPAAYALLHTRFRPILSVGLNLEQQAFRGRCLVRLSRFPKFSHSFKTSTMKITNQRLTC